MSTEEYKRIEGFDQQLLPCVLCGKAAELWEYTAAVNGPTKVAMCPTVDTDGAEDCPFVMPPQSYYRATKREAIKYWNDHRLEVSPAHRAVIEILIEIAHAAYHAMDDGEQREEGSGCSFEQVVVIPGQDAEDISDLLDRLDELPEHDDPNLILCPHKKAEYALRAIIGPMK